ncbi:hypothetical protein [Paraburkholderia sp. BCC1885]|uniref:hypothetical protein n=1 Tax=Paraburkholderia sp. BCC1885 TaxID=2562669 RepID=UPI0011833E7E|nr:hypothetical protein [Paraburkholderia sp. BCC1885]
MVAIDKRTMKPVPSVPDRVIVRLEHVVAPDLQLKRSELSTGEYANALRSQRHEQQISALTEGTGRNTQDIARIDRNVNAVVAHVDSMDTRIETTEATLASLLYHGQQACASGAKKGNMKITSISLPPEIVAQMKEEAHRRNLSLSGLVKALWEERDKSPPLTAQE